LRPEADTGIIEAGIVEAGIVEAAGGLISTVNKGLRA
jgi:hypothetical protein